MKTLDKLTVVSATLVLLAYAAAAASEESGLSRLTQAKQQLAAKANGQKGDPRARLDQERLRVSNLIAELEAGEHVDPSDIDAAVRRANEAAR